DRALHHVERLEGRALQEAGDLLQAVVEGLDQLGGLLRGVPRRLRLLAQGVKRVQALVEGEQVLVVAVDRRVLAADRELGAGRIDDRQAGQRLLDTRGHGRRDAGGGQLLQRRRRDPRGCRRRQGGGRGLDAQRGLGQQRGIERRVEVHLRRDRRLL